MWVNKVYLFLLQIIWSSLINRYQACELNLWIYPLTCCGSEFTLYNDVKGLWLSLYVTFAHLTCQVVYGSLKVKVKNGGSSPALRLNLNVSCLHIRKYRKIIIFRKQRKTESYVQTHSLYNYPIIKVITVCDEKQSLFFRNICRFLEGCLLITAK